jgi:hypothetical protein
MLARAYACACCRPVVSRASSSVHPGRGTRHTARRAVGPWRKAMHPTNHVRARGNGTEPLAWCGRVAVNARELARRHATDRRGRAGGARSVQSPEGAHGVKAPAPASQARPSAARRGPTRPRRQSGIDLQGITVPFPPFFPSSTFIVFFPSGNNIFLLFPLGGSFTYKATAAAIMLSCQGPPGIIPYHR